MASKFFLLCGLCALEGVHAALRGKVRRAPPGAKNIVFFECDEMDGRVMDESHPISKVANLPTLRSMAASGVNFVGAYADIPICAPSRASMFTGRRASSLQAWHNVKSLTADISENPPTKPDPNCAKVIGLGSERCLELGKRQNVSSTINMAMAQLGYDVQLMGKMDTGGGPVMLPPKTHSTGFHDAGTWASSNVTTYYPGCLLHSAAAGANISKPAFAPLDGPNDWVDTQHATFGEGDWSIVEECVEFLKAYKQGDPPFFLYCSVINPHPPYTSNSTWEAFVNKDELESSLTWAEKTYGPSADMHPADVYAMNSMGVPVDFNRTLARELALAYHGAIAMVDHMVASVRSALHQSEAAENTFMVFASDHGEMHLEHRRVEKMSMYEGSVRVPLIIEGPGVPQNVVVNDFVSLVDLFPTFLDMGQAVALPDAGLQGYSLAPFIGISPSRSLARRPAHIVSEYTAEEANTPQFMIRKGHLKYIAFGREPPYQNYMPQLFNVSSDPLEMIDLARHSSMASVMQELDDELRSVVDYPNVVKVMNSENRETVKQWMAAYTQQEWQDLVRGAYKDADDTDIEKLVRWVDMKGEFALDLSASESIVV